MKHYVTFGQTHVHRIGGKTIDCDCVAVLDCVSAEHGRQRAFELFGERFCFEYSESQWNHHNIKYYPRGYVCI